MNALGWKEIPNGGVITEAGSALKYKTGGWRTVKPVVDKENCRDCLICWIYCPDAAIKTKDGKWLGVDYAHCKGCGICASVCPKKCIEMRRE